MKRVITIGCACACASVLAVAVASAGNPTSEAHAKNLAAKQCTAEQKADRGAFRAAYGEHPMRSCIKGTTDEVQAELKNAAKECKAEREADPAAFRENYGTNENGSNAFGKCVSKKVRAEIKEDVAEFKNAAKECREERKADADAFREKYGNNHNGRNAFGKCVSQKVKHSEQQPV